MSAPISGPATSHPAQPGSARFTSAEFWRMMASGAFEDVWVELAEGELHRMPPPGRTHGQMQMALIAGLLRSISQERLFGEVAIGLTNDTVLAGDTVVLKAGGGTSPVIPATEVLLVAEVAVSTLDRDLGLKRSLYAAAGIPHYWVVDVERSVIHVFDRPERGDYMGLSLVRFGEPLAVPGTDATIVLQ